MQHVVPARTGFKDEKRAGMRIVPRVGDPGCGGGNSQVGQGGRGGGTQEAGVGGWYRVENHRRMRNGRNCHVNHAGPKRDPGGRNRVLDGTCGGEEGNKCRKMRAAGGPSCRYIV